MNKLTQFGFRAFVSLCYKSYGLDVFGMNKWLLDTLSWSSETRQEFRLKKLGDILEFAWNHVPFYREYWGDHGVEFRKPRVIDELQRYPILSKDVFRANAERIKPDNLDLIRHRKWHTGGTTGQPVHYLRDLEQWTLVEAFHLWGWSQAGYYFGDPVAVIAGGSLIPELKTFESRLREWMHRRLFLYGTSMNPSIARDYYDRICQHKTKFLYGYPSVLYLFSKNLAEQGLAIPGLKAVITTAEMLLPQYREGIEKTLACPVFDDLGCNDGGYSAYECHLHRGFHYNDLQSVLEVDYNDNSVLGRLLITNLWNKSTPFIRYENGDLVELASQTCPCGCSFPLISSIQGRTTDILTFANGISLSGGYHIFRDMEVDGWQMVQTSNKRLEVRLCSKYLKPDYDAFIHKVLKHHLGDDVEVVVKKVEELETTKGGKRKPVWSEA